MMRLASFDIFDTTLIRRCGHPDNIFWQVAKALFADDRAQQEAFVLQRQQATRRMPLPRGTVEHGLSAIYAYLATCGFAPYTAEEMMATELRIEQENLVVNPAIRTIIEKWRAEGYTIAFISDMYLDESVLTEVLRREGCLQGEERVWVSVVHQARKDSGKLYDLVRAHYKPTTWHHYGDHKHSDVRMAQRKGITAHHVLTPHTPIEEGLMHLPTTSNWERQALRHLAGWQRAYRIAQGSDATATLAVNTMVGVYVPYVMALLRDAERRGLKRLYFLSRDGYILMRIAERIVAHTQQAIELRYLFVSRHSLFLPYLYGDETASHYMAIREKTLRNESVDKLLRQLGADRSALAAVGLTLDFDTIRSDAQQEAFLGAVFSPAFAPYLRAQTAEATHLLHRYFEQEGLTDGTPAALVDVGWLGTSRKMINHILNRLGAPQAYSYYLGVRGDVLPPREGAYYSYLPEGRRSLDNSVYFIEHYFSASPYASTQAYREEAGRIVPVFNVHQAITPPDIVAHNVSAVTAFVDLFYQHPVLDEAVLRRWALYTLETFNALSVPIDISPLARLGKFDHWDFVMKLSALQILQLVCFDKQIVALKKASLQHTLGYGMTRVLWPIHQRLAGVKRLLYRVKMRYLA